MGFATVQEHRQRQLGRQGQLGIKGIFLLLWRREIAVEIESTLTDGDNPIVFSQPAQRGGSFPRPLAGMMRMNTRR